jgi:D-cysteine desulfhydrase
VTSVPLTRHEIDAFVAARAAELERAGRPAYGIPRGGATAVGAVGYALAAQEVVAQLGERTDVVIVAPAGSCASAAGLLAGLALMDSPHRLVAVSTNRAIDEARDVLLSLADGVVQRLGAMPRPLEERLTLHDRAAGTTDEDLVHVRTALRQSGIVAADHYGPPTLSQVVHEATAGQAATVVWWHTGGVLGMPSLLRRLDARPGAS